MGVDRQCSDYRYVISGVPQGSVLGHLLFILYSNDKWSGLGNRLAAYVDDAVPFPHMKPFIADSLNKISAW